MNKLVCLVGMPGAGKSEVAEYLTAIHKFGYFRFGQINLDKVKESGLPPTEKLEKEIREGLRREYGMAALAILNMPKIETLIKEGDVLGDGLRSYEEYEFLKEKLGDQFVAIVVYAPPKIRYDRLVNRSNRHGKDANLRYRSFTLEEAQERDINEIKGANVGGTFVMADFTISNISTIESLHTQVDQVLKNIFNLD